MFSIQTKRRNTRAKRAGERKGHQVLTIKEELDGRRRSWKMLQLTESLTGRECLRATAPFGSGVLEQQQQRNSLHKKIYIILELKHFQGRRKITKRLWKTWKIINNSSTTFQWSVKTLSEGVASRPPFFPLLGSGVHTYTNFWYGKMVAWLNRIKW